MSDSIYYCTNENNNCPKKDICKRYIKATNENHICTTLFNVACTQDNNYLLYIKYENIEEGGDT